MRDQWIKKIKAKTEFIHRNKFDAVLWRRGRKCIINFGLGLPSSKAKTGTHSVSRLRCKQLDSQKPRIIVLGPEISPVGFSEEANCHQHTAHPQRLPHLGRPWPQGEAGCLPHSWSSIRGTGCAQSHPPLSLLRFQEDTSNLYSSGGLALTPCLQTPPQGCPLMPLLGPLFSFQRTLTSTPDPWRRSLCIIMSFFSGLGSFRVTWGKVGLTMALLSGGWGCPKMGGRSWPSWQKYVSGPMRPRTA